jgi:hypothetical protein
MNNKSQSQTRPVARLVEPKPSGVAVAAHNRFVFGQDSNWMAGLTTGPGEIFCSILELSFLKTS